MKKIMVCCGSSMITSTIAINKLKTAMANAGIDVKFIQCKFAEVQGKVKVERPDVIVPTGALKDSLTDSVPVVRGTCFVTGGHRRDHQDLARLIAERNRKARRYHCP
jgi:PTS system galactitol-specific IIB component